MNDFILSAFADEYANSFEEQLQGMKALDIRYVEIRHLDGKNISALSDKQVNEAKRMLDASGIKVSAIGSPLGKIRLDGDMGVHLEEARRIFEAANILGTSYIRIFSFYAPEGGSIADMRGKVLNSLEKLVILARKYNVILCHENEANIYGDVPERCRNLIDYFHGELKCVFDMGNFVLDGIDPYPGAYELLKEDIAYFHIKDALYQGAIVPAGRGEAKIKEILSDYRMYAQKEFFVSLEPHLQTFAGLNALVGRTFENPYKYADQKVAFRDAVAMFREMF